MRGLESIQGDTQVPILSDGESRWLSQVMAKVFQNNFTEEVRLRQVSQAFETPVWQAPKSW